MALIEARGLHKTFKTTVALDGIDLRVEQGRILGIVGPNGADKEYALRYLDANFANHPEYQQMRVALGKLLDGKIIDHDDYLRFVFNLAPLYSDEMANMKNGL